MLKFILMNMTTKMKMIIKEIIVKNIIINNTIYKMTI